MTNESSFFEIKHFVLKENPTVYHYDEDLESYAGDNDSEDIPEED